MSKYILENTINGEVREVQPPGVEVEAIDQYRDNYFRLMKSNEKAFNLRKSELSP